MTIWDVQGQARRPLKRLMVVGECADIVGQCGHQWHEQVSNEHVLCLIVQYVR